jgi:DNA-binding MarR family transcriptional regulator
MNATGAPPPRRRNSCLQVLEEVRSLSAAATLKDVVAFLYVCENEGINLRELAQICGFTDSTASRTAGSLAAAGAPGALPPALGLIELRKDPRDDRSRTLHLTQRGRRLRDQVELLIAEARPVRVRPAPAVALCERGQE